MLDEAPGRPRSRARREEARCAPEQTEDTGPAPRTAHHGAGDRDPRWRRAWTRPSGSRRLRRPGSTGGSRDAGAGGWPPAPCPAYLATDDGPLYIDQAPAGTRLEIVEVRRTGPLTADLRVLARPVAAPELHLVVPWHTLDPDPATTDPAATDPAGGDRRPAARPRAHAHQGPDVHHSAGHHSAGGELQ